MQFLLLICISFISLFPHFMASLVLFLPISIKYVSVLIPPMQAFNVLRYEIGQKYDSHYDAFNPAEYGPQMSQRVNHLLKYLSVHYVIVQSVSHNICQLKGVTRSPLKTLAYFCQYFSGISCLIHAILELGLLDLVNFFFGGGGLGKSFWQKLVSSTLVIIPVVQARNEVKVQMLVLPIGLTVSTLSFSKVGGFFQNI